jgi:hypothetical protein
MRTLSYNNISVNYTDDLNFIQVRNEKNRATYILKEGEIKTMVGIKDKNEFQLKAKKVRPRDYIREMCRINNQFYLKLADANPIECLSLYEEAKATIKEQEHNEARKKMEKEDDRKIESYFTQIFKISKDEDYIRASWDAIVETTGYDGFDFTELSIRGQYQKLEEVKPHKIASIKSLDKKVRKGKPINVLKLIGFLAGIKEIREIIYNNDHGIVVRDPERNNYPEKVVMDTIKEIILEGLTFINGKDKETALMFLDSSPIDSIAGKVWKLIEMPAMDPVMHGKEIPKCSGLWEKYLTTMCREGGKRDPQYSVIDEHVTFNRNSVRKAEYEMNKVIKS